MRTGIFPILIGEKMNELNCQPVQLNLSLDFLIINWVIGNLSYQAKGNCSSKECLILNVIILNLKIHQIDGATTLHTPLEFP